MGGLIIIIVTLISTLIFNYNYKLNVKILIFTTLWLGFTGFIDDYIKIFLKKKQGLKAIYKLISQLILGILIGNIIYDIRLMENTNYYYLINNAFFDKLLFIIITISLIIFISNGANITDGIDGLTAFISSIIIFTIILNNNNNDLLIYNTSFLGSLIGFLWYNIYPAQIFLGDTGSLTIGGIIAVIALIIKKELLIISLCAIFIIELLSIVIQILYFKYTKIKYGIGKKIFLMSPLHHHFQKMGYHDNKISIRLIIIQLIISIIIEIIYIKKP